MCKGPYRGTKSDVLPPPPIKEQEKDNRPPGKGKQTRSQGRTPTDKTQGRKLWIAYPRVTREEKIDWDT